MSVQVLTLAGEELLSTAAVGGGEKSVADVLRDLEGYHPLLPGHEYKLTHGESNLSAEQHMTDLAAGAGELKLTAVVQQKPSMQEDLNLALVEDVETLDLARIDALLTAGASASFVHDPPGIWGSCDTKSALHVAIERQPRDLHGLDAKQTQTAELGNWKAVIQTLIDAKADVNAEKSYSDWRGCGGSSTAFEMVLPAAVKDAELLHLFLTAGANPNTTSRREVNSMRSEGSSCHAVLHTAVNTGNCDVIRTLLDARADVDVESTEKISNERGYNRDMRETGLHIACIHRNVKACALLIQYGANVNAVRKELVQEDVAESELEARCAKKSIKSKSKKKSPVMCDDPRDPDYVCPVRSVMVEETGLHIALQQKHEGLATLLSLAGADKDRLYQRGSKTRSVEDLCAGESRLLNAMASTWPLPSSCQLFSDDELASIKAAMASTAHNS